MVTSVQYITGARGLSQPQQKKVIERARRIDAKISAGPGFLIIKAPVEATQEQLNNYLTTGEAIGRIEKIISGIERVEAREQIMRDKIKKPPPTPIPIRELTEEEKRKAVLGLPREIIDDTSEVLRLTPEEIRADPRLRKAFGVIVNPNVIRSEKDVAEKIREAVRSIGITPPTETEDTASQVLKSAAFAAATLPATIIETPRSLFEFGQEIGKKGPIQAGQEAIAPFIEDPFRTIPAIVTEAIILTGGSTVVGKIARAAKTPKPTVGPSEFRIKEVKGATREFIFEEELLSDIPAAAERLIKTTVEAVVKPAKKVKPSRLTTEDLLKPTEEILKESLVVDFSPTGIVGRVKRVKRITKPIIEEKIVKEPPKPDPFYFVEAGSIQQVNTFLEKGTTGRISKIKAREIEAYFPRRYPKSQPFFRRKEPIRKKPLEFAEISDEDILAISIDAEARADLFMRGPKPPKEPGVKTAVDTKTPVRRLKPEPVVFEVEELTIPAVRPGQIPGLSGAQLKTLSSVYGLSFAAQLSQATQQRTFVSQLEKPIQKPQNVNEIINDILTIPSIRFDVTPRPRERERLDLAFINDLAFDFGVPDTGIKTEEIIKPPKRPIPFYEIPFYGGGIFGRRRRKPKPVTREFEFFPSLLGLELQLEQFEPNFLTGLEPRGIKRGTRKR